jgi:hypothetical protein
VTGEMFGRTFNGGDGNDSVPSVRNGTFNGGAGSDDILFLVAGGRRLSQ